MYQHRGLWPSTSPRCQPLPLQRPTLQHHQRPDVSVKGRRSDKIADRKGKENAKRAKVYGRMGKKIVSTVKAGGPDPIANVKLGDLLKLAKDLNVPRDIIERNIKRASDKSQADFNEVCYEAYGPNGTCFVVECLTDNVNRSASEVKSAINKAGCKVADPGSVMFSFTRAGQIRIKNSSEDAVFEAAMEAGADDVAAAPVDEDQGGAPDFKVFTSVEAFVTAKAQMATAGFAVDEEDSGLCWKPNTLVEVDDEAFARCEALLMKLLDLDDVDGVFSNCEGLDA